MAIGQDQFLDDGQLRAICIDCGNEKFEPWERCESCGKLPEKGDDWLKSLFLSVYRFESNPKSAEDYSFDLKILQKKILSGINVEYEASEMEKIRIWDDQLSSLNVTVSGKYRSLWAYIFVVAASTIILTLIYKIFM